MANIKLKKGEITLEIISQPSVLQVDNIMILYRKHTDYKIWEMQLTLEAAKILLVDKTKIIEIDEILNWKFEWNTDELIAEWGEKIFSVIQKTNEAKKKLKK